MLMVGCGSLTDTASIRHRFRYDYHEPTLHSAMIGRRRGYHPCRVTAFRCHAFGRVNVWMPYVDSVRPMPECLTPDHGSRGLTRSQQFQ